MGFRQIGLAAAAAALAIAAAPAGAQEVAPAAVQQVETNVNWMVSARAQPDKPPRQLCSLGLSLGGNKLQVSLRNTLAPDVKPEDAGQGSAFFLLTFSDKIVPGDKASLKTSLRIPEQASWDVPAAEWTTGKTGGTIGQFVDNQIGSVVQPLLRGKILEVTVTLPDGSTKDYSISLKGSSAAVSAFKLCLAQS